MAKVLIVATSRKTRGGITSVVKAYETCPHWNKYKCHWIQTHRDGGAWRKILYFTVGVIDFIFRIPFYDIVHINTSDFGSEKRKRIFARFTKLFRKKLIIHLHSSDPTNSIGGKYRKLYDFSFTHADKILLLSNSWLEVAKKAFPKEEGKMEVLYNPCPAVKPSLLEEREKYILFAGTLNARKGFEDLIKAFAPIAVKYPDWKLELAGNGEIDKGIELAKQLGIESQVKFLGWINGDEKDEAFRRASIYCLPSYNEGFPMGVLDAWAYHLPVITTPVGGIPDVAIDNENIMLSNPGDIKSLTSKLDALINDSELRAKMTDASKAFSNESFNISNISYKLDQIYHSLT